MQINNLDKDILDRIIEIQEIIINTKNIAMSTQEIITFLGYAMSFGSFQIETLIDEINGIELSNNELLKKFLSQTSNGEILRLYDISQNFNEANIENIRNSIEAEGVHDVYGMKVNETGNGKFPKISVRSRKKCASSLIK